MQEQFDKRLADKIRQEMEDYTPSFNKAHWAAMQKRMGRETTNFRKRILVSSFLVLISVMAYLPLGKLEDKSLPNQIEKLQFVENKENESSTAKEQVASLLDPSIVIDNKNEASKTEKNKIPQTQNQLEQIDNKETHTKIQLDTNKLAKNSLVYLPDLEEEKTGIEFNSNKDSKVSSELNEVDNALTINRVELTSKQNPALPFQENTKFIATPIIKSKPLVLDSTQQITQLFEKDKSLIKDIKIKKWSFSAVIDGFVNQNNRVNFRQKSMGIGGLANYRIKEKLLVSSGLILKKIHGKAFPDQSMFENDDEALNATSFDAFPSYGIASINNFAERSLEETELVTTTANLTAVEIPIQLSYYIFNNSRKRIYVSATTSSYFYLNEKYQFEKEGFRLPARANARKLSIINEFTEYGAFQNIDFASTVSFSVGIEKNITPGSTIQLEPFVSLPLMRMGTENIPFNSTGVRLKYTFGR